MRIAHRERKEGDGEGDAVADQPIRELSEGAERALDVAVKLMSRANTWIFQKSGGRFGARFLRGAPVLLLTTTGARSGERRTTPLIYVEDAGRTPTDTYDGIHIDTVRAFVHGNKIRAESGATRSAINIAGGDCYRVAGNDLGDPSTYATDALIDAGTDTQLTWPNDPTYGDNFTICPTSPTSP